MDKEHILDEIKRTARENGGVPLGVARFSRITGIRHGDWYGKHWVRWGEALREAGFAPNSLNRAFDEDVLIERYVRLIRELGRFPVKGDLMLKRRTDPLFPSHNTFRRFGSKRQLSAKIIEYCRIHPGFEDVVAVCRQLKFPADTDGHISSRRDENFGSVYLIRAGRYYKIGKTNAAGRRERELAIQLPERTNTVHVIRTDDPMGIEAYWHSRFVEKRRHGEWFELDHEDVAAFKRRKFM